MAKRMKIKNHIVINSKKQACNSLVFIAEATDVEKLSKTCTKMIAHLCERFDLTVFESLPDDSNRSMPG